MGLHCTRPILFSTTNCTVSITYIFSKQFHISPLSWRHHGTTYFWPLRWNGSLSCPFTQYYHLPFKCSCGIIIPQYKVKNISWNLVDMTKLVWDYFLQSLHCAHFCKSLKFYRNITGEFSGLFVPNNITYYLFFTIIFFSTFCHSHVGYNFHVLLH